MNQKSVDRRENLLKIPTKTARHLMTSTLALSLLLGSGALPSPQTVHARMAVVSNGGENDPQNPNEATIPTHQVDLTRGSATVATVDTRPGYFPLHPTIGVIHEAFDAAEKNIQPQPQLGSESLAFRYPGGVLSDGKTTPGEIKGLEVVVKAGALQQDPLIDDVAIAFPGTTEQVGMIFTSNPDKTVTVVQKYVPNEEKWLPKHGAIVLRGIDHSQDLRVSIVYDQTGEARRWTIRNGTRAADEIRPQSEPPAYAKTQK